MRSKSGSTTRTSARLIRGRLAILLLLVAGVVVAPFAHASAQSIPPTSTTTAPPVTTGTSTTTSQAPPSSSTTATSTTVAPPVTTGGGSTTTKPGGSTTTQAPGAPAQNDPTLLDQLKAGNDELSTDELDLLQRFLDAQGEVNSITDELIRINEQYLTSQQDMLDAISRVAESDDRLKRTNDQLARAQDELDHERDQMQQDAVSAYVGGGKGMSEVRAMIKAETVDDLSKSRVYASAVAEDEQSLVDHYRDLHRQVDDLRRRADQDRNDATTARDSLAARQTALDQQRTELLDTRDKKQSSVEDQVKLLAEVETKKGDFLRKYTEHSNSGGDVGAKLKTLQAGETLPASTIGILRQPLETYKLSQSYGNHVNSLYGTGSFHPGIDMAAPSGTPIYAPADGVVMMAEWYDGYGNCTVIMHGNGIATLYGHQTEFAVQQGDHVAAGAIIGYVGSTGYSTGPHLHWEVRVFGETDDPIPYMRPI